MSTQLCSLSSSFPSPSVLSPGLCLQEEQPQDGTRPDGTGQVPGPGGEQWAPLVSVPYCISTEGQVRDSCELSSILNLPVHAPAPPSILFQQIQLSADEMET